MDKELKEWYGKINEEDVQPNGLIKIKVPVLDADSGDKVIAPQSDVPEVDDCEEPIPSNDPVINKDKAIAMKAFILNKRIGDILIRSASLTDPYQEDSEERQELLSKLKALHNELGVTLATL